MTGFVLKKIPKGVIDHLDIPIVLAAAFLINNCFIMKYWREYSYILHTCFESVCVFILLNIFFLYWLSAYKNHLFSNIIAYGFLSVAMLKVFHILFFIPLGLVPYNTVDLSIKYCNFGRGIEVGMLLLLSLNAKIYIKSNKLFLVFTIIFTAMISYMIYHFYNYIPELYSEKSGATFTKIVCYIIEILVYMLVMINLIIKFKRTSIISYKYIYKSVIFLTISSVLLILYSDIHSEYMLLGHAIEIFFYCYIFRGLFNSMIIYPYDKIESLYNESEERFKSAFDRLISGVILTDLNGNTIKANEHCMRMLGYSEETFSNFNINDILPSEGVTLNIEYIVAILENYKDKILTYDKYYKTTKGNEVWIRVNISVTNDISGKPLYLLYEIQDNSSKRKVIELESNIEKKGKIIRETQELDKLRIEFFANLSHELRTPLNVISGAIQLFELNFKNKPDEKILKNINYMKQNCRRMLRLVNNLLDTTQIESGFYKLKLKNINIVNLVEDIAMSVSDYMKLKEIELVFDTEVEEKIIACDPDKMERIILNLLSNAIKFTNPGGKVFVELFDKGEEILISVKDTGIGIPEEKQKLVFERFRQVDKSLVKNQEGSGIGLSLTKALVDLHGGTISLKSKLGSGSEFIIKLPVLQSQQNIVEEVNNTYNDRVERIKIEFSDIYISN